MVDEVKGFQAKRGRVMYLPAPVWDVNSHAEELSREYSIAGRLLAM
jgi:hypothetical protein